MVSANASNGHPGHLDPKQQHMVYKLREDLKAKGYYAADRHDDACMCRFLRARKWDYHAANGMMMEAEKWRREYKVDELYETFTFPEKEAVNELYPQFYHKTDKDGRPVYVEQLTHLDLNKLFKVTTPERLIQQLVYEYEKCQRERLPVCSEMSNKLIETSCTIMDLKNVGIAQFWRVSSYVQQASKIGQFYYPETMGRFYIINAPYIFTTVWSVVKSWLDPVTREKIQILGSNFLTELSKQIPTENIPSIVGGSCQCPGGCLMSDAGPWNTPEGEEIIRRVRNEKQRLKLDDSDEPHDTSAPSNEQDKSSAAAVANSSAQQQESSEPPRDSEQPEDAPALPAKDDTVVVPPSAKDSTDNALAIPMASDSPDVPAPPVQIQPPISTLAPPQ